ncbi:MAG: beta-N-acetylhexosaminidase [Nitrospinota bacterium]
MSRLTVDEAVGQLLIIGFEGKRYSYKLEQFYRKYRPAGLILFSRNIESIKQTEALTTDLAKMGADISGRPLLLAIDEEGGRVSRLSPDMPKFLSAREIGIEGDANDVVTQYRAIANFLVSIGLNLDFAPVLDINSNKKNSVIGDRAFSSNKDLVAILGRAAIVGLREGKVLACAKHFIGHGGTLLDSHYTLPHDSRDKELILEDSAPFQEAINEGLNFLMPAHVIYDQIDKRFPATFSEIILKDYLRDKFQYKNIVISDDLHMDAILNHYEPDNVARLAFKAGIDMLLICHNEQYISKIFNAAKEGIDSGDIDETSVLASMLRVEQALSKLPQP